MADDAHESFDLDELRKLIEMMEKHDLREVKLKRGNQKWALRRGPQEVAGFGAPPMYPVPSMTAAHAPAPTAPTAGAPPKTGEDEGLVTIKSPTVGTFYQAPQPGDPPFVKVGDKVRPDTVVCIVEAMKVFNQIPAEVSGVLAKALARDGDAVEYGQALFLVRPD